MVNNNLNNQWRAKIISWVHGEEILPGCAPKLLWDYSRIALAPLPDCSRHTLPCSGYAPGCSGSLRRCEVGPKMEREEGLEAFAEMYHNSITTINILYFLIPSVRGNPLIAQEYHSTLV